MFQNYSLSCNFPDYLIFFPLTGNDLEALQLHLCIFSSDFTVEGQLSLEAPLINVTRKPLPQQTKGKEEKTYNNRCYFFKNKNLFSENSKGNLEIFHFKKKLYR